MQFWWRHLLTTNQPHSSVNLRHYLTTYPLQGHQLFPVPLRSSTSWWCAVFQGISTRMHAATAHFYPLNFNQNQGALGLKQPVLFQTKTLLCPAVSVKYLLKPFLRFANDLPIIRYCYIALATYTKLNLLRYFWFRQANNVSNKLAFPTILIMKMLAFLWDKS